MIKLSTTLVASAAMVLLSACGSSTEGGAASGSAKASSAAAAKGSAAPTAEAKKAPELVDVKNEKRKLSFKAPKDLKSDPSGDSYSWDTMQIMVEQTMDPIAKNEDLMKVAPGTTTEGATPESSTEGEVLISSWKQKEGPAWAVCGQKGKSVALRLGFEPAHKDVAMGICKSLKVD
jgi:hypothetical protein